MRPWGPMKIRELQPQESATLGRIMVEVYSKLDGFPGPSEQPDYYEMLRNIGQLCSRPHTQVVVALSDRDELLGGVVYFSDMAEYGSGGNATTEKNASGFRLLAVRPEIRGGGVGKALTEDCIRRARESGSEQLIIHTTEAMKVAWSMYERMGFERSEDLDFMQEDLPVMGFRMNLTGDEPH